MCELKEYTVYFEGKMVVHAYTEDEAYGEAYDNLKEGNHNIEFAFTGVEAEA